jgi:hypothetical protein
VSWRGSIRFSDSHSAVPIKEVRGLEEARRAANNQRAASDAGRGDINKGRTFIVTLSIPPMDSVELVIASAIFGVLILWFGYYLWRQIRDR